MGAVQTDNSPEGFDRSDLIFALAMCILFTFVLITSKNMETDFTFRDEGTIIVLVPQTPAAHTWCRENLPPDQYGPPDTHVIEHRYFRDILNGILEEPLTIRKQ